MTAAETLLGALTDEPTSTDDLYGRIGYPALVRIALVPFDAFRVELVRLSKQGLAETGTDEDGATTWRRPAGPEEEGSAAG
jgi:hypothetical protein